MDNTSVKNAFDRFADIYDASRRKLIPCFDDFYTTVLMLIPFQNQEDFCVLDLGAGTGLLSMFIAEKFTSAKITLMDISEDMLVKARKRFLGKEENINFVVGDYTQGISGKFDLVVSALSIHHMTDQNKVKLFQSIYHLLPKGGLFINADQVLGASSDIDENYRNTWTQQVHQLGISDTDFQAAQERMKEDKMATLTSQLTWLQEVGFESVNCWYKNFGFAVFSGRK